MLLQTSRLFLREYTIEDYSGVHEYACDPEVTRFMTWGPNQPKDTRAFIQMAISQQSVEPRVNFHFVVILRESGRIIGGCGIHIQEPEQRTAYIGYGFNRDYWGQGYATEAAGALLKFGFEELGLHRIVATCDLRNLGSVRVMEKNGMRQEAHFVEHIWQKGEWRDSLLYAILEREWQE